MRRLVKTLLKKAGLFADERTELAEARLQDVIGLHHFHLGPGSVHPFANAVRAGIEHPAEPAQAVRAALEQYYGLVQPRDAAEWLGLEPHLTPGALSGEAPLAVTFPWQNRSPAAWRKARTKGIPRENELAGQVLPIEAGWHACGPVAPEKADVEARRLSKLLASLQEHGFKRHDGPDGDIDGVALVLDGQRRYWINSGHHRSAALSALGYETAPVRVRAVFDVRDAAQWPNVRNGFFPEDAAVALVDRLFRGELPAVVAPWERHIAATSYGKAKVGGIGTVG